MAVGLRLEDSPYSWLWPSRPRLWKASERIENFWCRVEELESKRLHGTLTPMAGTTSNDPSFPLKCPNCGLATQYNLAYLKERVKLRNQIEFSCVACQCSKKLTIDELPGLREALDSFEL